ncbi:MAG TPA: class I SAM-dependent methyltransferase [Gemmataceae bacterium]
MKTQIPSLPRFASGSSGAAVQAGGRTDSYYDQARPEVAALVPSRCRRVLEVGCGSGQFGRLLRDRGHHVTGIELVPEMAERARPWLDRIVTADIESEGFPFPSASFDALVFADVLEHLLDPWRVLREAVEVLAEDGVVVASIPNVQNIDILRRLLRGRWDYRERGILDFGHLRFFTLHSIRSLFAQADLRIVHVGHRYRRGWWRELLCWLSAGRARCLWTRQYLIVARRAG